MAAVSLKQSSINQHQMPVANRSRRLSCSHHVTLSSMCRRCARCETLDGKVLFINVQHPGSGGNGAGGRIGS